MKPEEVRNLNWVKVDDWDGMTATYEEKGEMYISKKDIIAFVENIFREVARKLDIPAKKLLPIMQDENNAFFQILSDIFADYDAIGPKAEVFLELKKLLRVPDIYFSDKKKTTVENLIYEFNKLSVEDKKKFTQVLITQFENDSKIDSQKVIEYFNGLPDIEKFNVMKYLGLFDIRLEIIPK